MIMSLIAENDRMTVRDIADKIGISKRRCERIVASLKKSGIIVRTGAARNGRWIIKMK